MPVSFEKPSAHPETRERIAEAGRGIQQMADASRRASPQIQQQFAEIGQSLQGAAKRTS